MNVGWLGIAAVMFVGAWSMRAFAEAIEGDGHRRRNRRVMLLFVGLGFGFSLGAFVGWLAP
jgi:hypothetical protein